MSNFPVEPGTSIQNAIDRAAADGGGTVVLNPGLHRTGTIYLKSNIELHLSAGACLCGGERPEEYDELPEKAYGEFRPCGSSLALIAAAEAENIAITGNGVIDGSGPAFYQTNMDESGFFYARSEKMRPRLLQLVHCTNVKLEGVRLRNAPSWTIWLVACSDVVVHALRITGDPRMLNNDGLNLSGCQRVAVSDCFISSGDDALVVRAGRPWKRNLEYVAENIVVNNCVLESSCQGIRIGCPCDDTIRSCRFSNLVIRSRNVGIYVDNPIRYLSVACESPRLNLDDISFDHISVESQTKPIAVEVEEGVKLRRIGRLQFSNITFSGKEPLCFTGSSETVLEEIRLSHLYGKVFGTEETIRTRFVNSLILDHCFVSRVS